MVKPLAEVLAALAAFPETEVETFLAGCRPMILAPHPDDETLGCGGLIAAASRLGLAPLVVFLTDGEASHIGSRSFPPEQLATLRRQEAQDALARLSQPALRAGLPPARAAFLGYPDGALPAAGAAAARLINALAALGRDAACHLILAPWVEDPHCDHQAAAMLARTVAAQLRWPLWFYSVWGWLLPPEAAIAALPRAGGRLRIGAELALKQAAIAAHRSQLGEVVFDAQTAFVLPPALLALATLPFETVFQV